MPKLRYLKIRFSNPVFPREIPYFRSAVIEATRRQSSLFHNHKQEGFHYRYPLIQYKVTQRKASIVCLDSGVDDIHYLLENRRLELRLGRRDPEDFVIEDVELHYHDLECREEQYQYSLKDWQALNQDNYRRYEALETELERLQFLQKLLLGNLLAFARSIDWDTEGQLQVDITRMKQQRWLKFKGRNVLCFSLNFRTNAALPDYIGLGKGVSLGFGSVKRFGRGRRNSNTDRAGSRPSNTR